MLVTASAHANGSLCVSVSLHCDPTSMWRAFLERVLVVFRSLCQNCMRLHQARCHLYWFVLFPSADIFFAFSIWNSMPSFWTCHRASSEIHISFIRLSVKPVKSVNPYWVTLSRKMPKMCKCSAKEYKCLAGIYCSFGKVSTFHSLIRQPLIILILKNMKISYFASFAMTLCFCTALSTSSDVNRGEPLKFTLSSGMLALGLRAKPGIWGLTKLIPSHFLGIKINVGIHEMLWHMRTG